MLQGIEWPASVSVAIAFLPGWVTKAWGLLRPKKRPESSIADQVKLLRKEMVGLQRLTASPSGNLSAMAYYLRRQEQLQKRIDDLEKKMGSDGSPRVP
jgi:hypothetical protein